jgi:putative two-component system response regulator
MTGSVLFVDDESHILRALNRLFMDEPCETIFLTSPIKALEKLKETQVSVVVSDQRMPEMEGIVFLEKVKEHWPDTVRIMMTGHGDLAIATEAVNRGGIHHFINKPWSEAEIKQAVKDGLDCYRILMANRTLLNVTRKEYQGLAELNKNLEQKVQERTEYLMRSQEGLKGAMGKLQKTLEETIFAMAHTVELRDPYTAGHQRRVAQIACAIAGEMGLSRETIDAVFMAGMIHDIGKISVPAELLSKPGKLTEVERNLIKTHPQTGFNILKDIEFPWPVAQIVLQHHERMNGSGYPHGLSGEKILLEARILGVADVIEAVTSYRPHSPARPLQTAFEEIQKHRGTLYDDRVAEAALKLMKNWRFTLE